MNNCTDTSSLQNAISTASRLEEDIYCVMLYDMQGNLLLDGNDNNDKVKSSPTNLSFDKAAFSGLTDGYAITQPQRKYSLRKQISVGCNNCKKRIFKSLCPPGFRCD